MRITKWVVVLQAATGLVLVAMLVALFGTFQAANRLESAHAQRNASYLLADEMRQSSDDLTRLARTYVVTGDPRFEEQYLEVLAIRNGESPRPEAYHRVYWDFVAETGEAPRPAGEPVALTDLMEQAGFSDTEFALLDEAQAKSNALVDLEVVAMNAVKGLFRDEATGEFTVQGEPDLVLARDLLHSQDYHTEKAKIMEPIDEFFVALDQRTGDAVAEASSSLGMWRTISLVAFGAVALVVSVVGIAMQRGVVRPLRGLAVVGRRLAEGEDDVTLEYSSSNEIGDVADAYRALTEAQRLVSRQAEAVAAGELAAEVLDEEVPGRLGRSVKRMTETLTLVSSQADAIARGQLSSEVLAERAPGALGDSLQGMVERLQTIVSQLQSTSDSLSRSASELSASSEEVVAASSEVEVRANRAEDGSRGVTRLAGDIGHQVTEVSEGLDTLGVAMTEVDEAVQAATRQTSLAVTRAGETREIVEALTGASTAIGGIVQTIREIADQTNLLALNAAIEAARAGDAGMGFAVVATEVKSLAEETASSTEAISEQITAMQQSCQNAAIAIDGIASVIEEIDEIAGTIARAAGSQGAAAERMTGAVSSSSVAAGEIGRASGTLENDASETRESTGTFTETAAHLADNATRLAGLADEMVEILGQFS